MASKVASKASLNISWFACSRLVNKGGWNHEKLGYSPNSNMRCKLGSLFFRGCVWWSPGWFVRRPYGFSVLYCSVWLCPCDGMLWEYAHDVGYEDTIMKTRLHVSSAIILWAPPIIHQPRAQHHLSRNRPCQLQRLSFKFNRSHQLIVVVFVHIRRSNSLYDLEAIPTKCVGQDTAFVGRDTVLFGRLKWLNSQ